MEISNYSATSPNFGWKQEVHKCIGRKLVKEVNELLPESQKINSDKFIKTLLDVDNEIAEGKVQEHFADITERKSNDAVALFRFSRKEAAKAQAQGDIVGRDNYLARALHFLQDSLCSVHVKPQEVRSKDARRIHENFEKGANAQVMRFTDNFVPLKGEATNENFDKNYRKMLRSNKKLSEQIGSESFPMLIDSALNNTMKMSKMFFDNFFGRAGA